MKKNFNIFPCSPLSSFTFIFYTYFCWLFPKLIWYPRNIVGKQFYLNNWQKIFTPSPHNHWRLLPSEASSISFGISFNTNMKTYFCMNLYMCVCVWVDKFIHTNRNCLVAKSNSPYPLIALATDEATENNQPTHCT